MNQKLLIFILVLLQLMTKIQSGPAAPGVWTACVAACGSLAWNPILFGICWAACGPGGSLACFANDTFVISQKGLTFVGDLRVGDFVLT